MRRLVLLAVAAAGLAAVPTASAANCAATSAAGGPVCVRAFEQGPLSSTGSFKPKRINTIETTVPVFNITWISWTATKAVGKGNLLRCGGSTTDTPGPRVTITLSAPIEYFCGPSADEVESIGKWFSKARVQRKGLDVTRGIIDKGHPNAC
jgi:hypothetical protein